MRDAIIWGVLIHVAPTAEERVEYAREWLLRQPDGEDVLIVGSTLDAAADLVRRGALARASALGWRRATLSILAVELAQSELARRGATICSRRTAEALAARIVHEMHAEGRLGRFDPVATTPGLPRALASTLSELRESSVVLDRLRDVAPELAAISAAFDESLAKAHLFDWAMVLEAATNAAQGSTAHPFLDTPTLLLDVAIRSRAEAKLIHALARRSPSLVATIPQGDERTLGHLDRYVTSLESMPAPDKTAQPPAAPHGSQQQTTADDSLVQAGLDLLGPATGADSPGLTTGLERIQRHVFHDAPSATFPSDDSVAVLSAPGEAREAVEIGRRVHELGREGVPFDQIAVLLRSPEAYRRHIAEAFGRAGVPIHYSRGATLPDPSGRAFLALLRCADERLSAVRFAEYMSLGQVPRLDEGRPPSPPAFADRWEDPDHELFEDSNVAHDRLESPSDGPSPMRPEGTLRAPRRWEQLLVDAAVVGGIDRWRRRLAGLRSDLESQLVALEEDDAPAIAVITRSLEDLEHLREFAIPLLEDLDALPAEAPWSEWLEALSAIASRALRYPDRVHAVLSDLAPMGPVGPVKIAEIIRVLGHQLHETAEKESSSRYGSVYVALLEAARGMTFHTVFVAGLAEKLFPRKIAEDPILLDHFREQLDADLVTNADRVAEERLLFRIGVGAARHRLFLSYPRLEMQESRPRVPSFYTLEALKAARGELPGFEDVAAQAERITDSRVGWPAPARREDAIDSAEYDLALLGSLLDLDEPATRGAARYLLTANPHLDRAIRHRYRRWGQSWSVADGLMVPPDKDLPALARHQLDRRSFSPTALQNFAVCPYRFVLYTILRLAPREVPVAIEELNPLQRGSLIHDTQYELLTRLREKGELPVRAGNLEAARTELDAVLDSVAARYRDELAPAIERVWQDGVETARADLREWLRRESESDSGFVPWRFELAFGLEDRGMRDAHSVAEPVALDAGIKVRGSIDLVERHPSGTLRVTDHKTGRVRAPERMVIDGGRTLQPVIYALAAERLFDEPVESGRLYFSTARGGYEVREVPLGDVARASADALVRTLRHALEEGRFPAAPESGACRWCDYIDVCGHQEEFRTQRKPKLGILTDLRSMQ